VGKGIVVHCHGMHLALCSETQSTVNEGAVLCARSRERRLG